VSAAVLQAGEKLVVVGLLVEIGRFEAAGIAIRTSSIQKGVAHGGLVVGFPLGDIEGIGRADGSSRVVIRAVAQD
jgi:hypothetical protein